jgi:hypothetical protein
MIFLAFIRRMLYGPAPYLGCLSNKDLDEEIKWAKIREST